MEPNEAMAAKAQGAAEVASDRDRYFKALASMNGHVTAFAIEKKYSLDGYPPEIVSVALNAGASGDNMHEAIDRYLGAYDDDPGESP